MEKDNHMVITDRREAIKYAIHNALKDDVILLAGKGHEDYQEIKGVHYPFDEKVIVKEILDSMN
jgi:UDP-N-acetylmuramoyl-L-alanyl-D-glutamate--2,6-diaminopimelate ligase